MAQLPDQDQDQAKSLQRNREDLLARYEFCVFEVGVRLTEMGDGSSALKFEMIQEELLTNWFNNDADGQTGGSPTDRPAAAPIASRQPTPRSGGCMEDWSSCDQMEAQPPPAAAERERTRSPGTAGTRPLRVLPS